MVVEVLSEEVWRSRAAAHAARVDALVAPHLARRRHGEKHPVHDFLFTYYSQRPAQLRRWHPGWGVALAGAEEYAGLKGYEERVVCPTPPSGVASGTRPARAVSRSHLASQRPLVEGIHALLVATAGRAPQLGCFGLHEWAMVHGQDETRHSWPLRLGRAGTDEVVESHRIACSHFDAYRFFTPTARPLNRLRPGRDDRAAYEQPACLHAGMDLYKHAFRLTPLVPSELVADCFELARAIRELDMRAAPYDLRDLGFEPVRIETPEGKQEYVAAQRGFAERGAPLRQRLVEECERLLLAAGPGPEAQATGSVSVKQAPPPGART
ncbi:3-methyladenine DNA glycosylase [Nocardioides taihuensis]|uniref:3-methyladenine DNA glycosylase n=1 Tax=Nocardioides taihuensis TaxID=1835606 RepID=A0ABW0BQP1_9ACTN